MTSVKSHLHSTFLFSSDWVLLITLLHTTHHSYTHYSTTAFLPTHSPLTFSGINPLLLLWGLLMFFRAYRICFTFAFTCSCCLFFVERRRNGDDPCRLPSAVCRLPFEVPATGRANVFPCRLRLGARRPSISVALSGLSALQALQALRPPPLSDLLLRAFYVSLARSTCLPYVSNDLAIKTQSSAGRQALPPELMERQHRQQHHHQQQHR